MLCGNPGSTHEANHCHDSEDLRERNAMIARCGTLQCTTAVQSPVLFDA